ncbi:histone-lysine N-methyltransferase SETMAR [Trichonephila clavipes]|nr:histone-lysine N-methyltransferase SETMAR [Trichonephila clavipes]
MILGYYGHRYKCENASQAAEIVNGVCGADTVTANSVQFQFRRFRSGIFILKMHLTQDNTRPHTSVVPRQNLWELGWKVLMHPQYSPYLAPSDYYLFLALQNFLGDKKLGSREDCENRLLDVFANKGQDFYERGIMKLPLKWQQIIQQSGAYLTQIGQSEAC